MSWLSRMVNVARGRRLNQDLDDEFHFHMSERADELMREGVPAKEAHARARRLFGNAGLFREESRDARVWTRLASLVRDVRFALRLYRRSPTITVASLVSLSLAIGTCTAAYSLVDALVLRPLPVNDPNSLIYVGLREVGSTQDGLSFNYPLFAEMRTASRGRVALFALSD